MTAQHVVSGLQQRGLDIWLRVNRIDGTVHESQIPTEVWLYHPGGPDTRDTDVAAAIVEFIPGEDVALVPIMGPRAMAATKDVIKTQDLGVGDEVAIVGLFRSHYGHERNVPIVRIGNIAMLEGEPVRTVYCGYTDAYLIEARSIGGLSGSPVFVSMPPFRVLNGKTVPYEGPKYYLLGLMHGHFDIQNLREDTASDDASDAGGGINTGVGVVIPVEKILETLDQEELRMKRQDAIKRHFSSGATPDA